MPKPCILVPSQVNQLEAGILLIVLIVALAMGTYCMGILVSDRFHSPAHCMFVCASCSNKSELCHCAPDRLRHYSIIAHMIDHPQTHSKLTSTWLQDTPTRFESVKDENR